MILAPRAGFKVRVTLIRQRDLDCSACRATVDAGVRVMADVDRPTSHFLLCRRCAQRIGRVGQSIGLGNEAGGSQ